jgi:triacylglycerol lipase
MKVKLISLFLTMFLVVPASLTAAPLTGTCIALVHGILGFDDTNGLAGGLVKYWGGLDAYLRTQGAKVTTPGSAAANSIQTRAAQTVPQLNTFMASNGCTKIHLIGHSQGGLVVRYITSNLGFASKVATVTTIDSLHNGTPIADIILGAIPGWLKPFANTALSALARLVYRDGRSQDVITMGNSLTIAYSKSFSAGSPNVAGIKYYSYGNKMAFADFIQHPIMAITYPITWAGGIAYGVGGANDGVVPLSSQAWGTWKGSASAKWYATGIDHLQATNFEWTGQGYFDVNGWYLGIAQNAKAGL